jgi:hypothetical protein
MEKASPEFHAEVVRIYKALTNDDLKALDNTNEKFLSAAKNCYLRSLMNLVIHSIVGLFHIPMHRLGC